MPSDEATPEDKKRNNEDQDSFSSMWADCKKQKRIMTRLNPNYALEEEVCKNSLRPLLADIEDKKLTGDMIKYIPSICEELNSWCQCQSNDFVDLVKKVESIGKFMYRFNLFKSDRLEIQVHIFKKEFDEPIIHNHRTGFISCCLSGMYMHNIHISKSPPSEIDTESQTLELAGNYPSYFVAKRFKNGEFQVDFTVQQGEMETILSHTFEVGGCYYISPNANHTVEGLSESSTTVTLVFKDLNEENTAPEYSLFQSKSGDAMTRLSQEEVKIVTVANDEEEKKEYCETFKRALKNYCDIKNYVKTMKQ